MTLRVALLIEGNSASAQKAVTETSRGIKQLAQDARGLPTTNPFKPLDAGAQQAGNSVGSLRMIFKTLAREAALVGGPMAGLIGQTGTLAVGMGRVGGAATAGVVAIAAVVATVYKAVSAFSDLEQHQARVATMLAATKTASGQTVQGLEEMARALSKSGTQSLDDIRAAQAELLRYKAVSGDTFGAVLKIARDVAASGIAPLKDVTSELGQAFADPANAMDHLKAVMLSLSVAQQQLVKDLVATGRTSEALRLMQDALSKQYAGADARAADTLGGAFGRLAGSSGSFFEQIGKEISDTLRLKDVLNATADAAERYNRTRAAGTVPLAGNPLTLPFRVGTAIGNSIAGSIGLPVPQPPPPAPPRAGRVFAGGFGAAFDEMSGDIAKTQASTAERKRQAEAVNAVVNALEVEARTAGMSATAQKIYDEQTKAGVRDNEQYAAAAAKVAGAVNEIASKNLMRQVTEQFIAQNSALRAQAATAGMALGPAEAYRKEQELLARAEAEGTTLSAARRAEIARQAQAYGALSDAAARAKLASDISFERKTLFMSDEDVVIATRLRDLYGNDIPAAMASTEAAQLRINTALKSFKDGGIEITSSLFRDLRAEMEGGAKAMDALRTAGSKALGTLADKLSDMAAKKLWESALGGSGSGGLFSLFGIFGRSGTAGVAATNVGPADASFAGVGAAPYADGGYTGNIDTRAIAGVVHGKEYVINADATARHLPLLEAINSGRFPGYADGGYVGAPPTMRAALGGNAAPVIHVHPAAKGETFDAQQNPDGSIALVGRMIDDRLDAFSRSHLPTRVHDIIADPWAR